jgi:glycosyltransferase involved in cell wall biosynthesis
MPNQKLKSVHITNYFHENSGGVKTSYLKLLESANEHKRFVRLIVPGEEPKVEDIGEYGKIYYISAKKFPFFDNRYRIMLPYTYIQSGSPIRDILEEELPDIIEIYDNTTLTLLAGLIRNKKFEKLKRPMLIYYTGERLDTLVNTFISKGRFGKWFARRLLGNYHFPMFDFHIANSPFVAEELYESVRKNHNPRRFNFFFNYCWRLFKASRIPLDKGIRIVPRGVNPQFFSPEKQSPATKKEIKETIGIPENSVILLYAGRISPDKNIKLLVEMMEVLVKDKTQDFRLVVAGGGPHVEWLQNQATEKFPQKIIQVGYLDKENLANYYANCDIFIHPNPREPFGNGVLEAMASGTSVLAPNSGGILFYASDENAWLTEPTAENFADKVREIIGKKDLRQQKITNALAVVQENTNQKAIGRLFDLYDEMYEEFRTGKDLFANVEESKKFDYLKLIS